MLTPNGVVKIRRYPPFLHENHEFFQWALFLFVGGELVRLLLVSLGMTIARVSGSHDISMSGTQGGPFRGESYCNGVLLRRRVVYSMAPLVKKNEEN